MMEIGSSGNRDIGKPNIAMQTGRHGEIQELQIMISTSDLTSSNSPLCSFASSVVKGFSALTSFVLTTCGNFGIAGNAWWIGVSS